MTTTADSPTKLPNDLKEVRRRLEQLVEESRFTELIELVVLLLAKTRESHNKLAARLADALRELYGRKSQRITKEDLTKFLGDLGKDAPESAVDAANPQPAEPEKAPETGNVPQPPNPPKPPPARGGRSPLPPNLPRKQHKVTVPTDQRACAKCGRERVCIGYRTSNILDFKPAEFFVVEEQCEKLACPQCPEEGVETAPSEKVMDGGRPGPGLLANIVVEKFVDAMPLYRQAQAYERSGLWISPSTLGDWAAFALDALAPIAARILERVLASDYVRADDTGMRVLDSDHANGVKLGHIWGFVGAEMVAFAYAPNWKADHPAALLQDFKGYLQGDGYAGYAAMLRDDDSGEPIVPEERRLGCAMHIRAKFEKAARAKDPRGAVALAFFKAIYRIEDDCKTEGLSPDARKARRDELSLPLVDKMYTWIHEVHGTLVPGTLLFTATQYAINQEDAWRRCFTDGRFEIDNGEVERQIRPVALGRKNYMFAGSDKGAERLAIAYTIFGSCRMCGANPLEWATDVLARLQSGWPRSRLDELLPDAWVKARSPADQPISEASDTI